LAQLRPALATDAAAIAAILRALASRTMPWLASEAAPRDLIDRVRRDILGRCRVWLAIEPPIGGGAATLPASGFVAWRGDWLDWLAVVPARGGRGIGRSLLDLAKAEQPALMTFRESGDRGTSFLLRNGFAQMHAQEATEPSGAGPVLLLSWIRPAR
jgi:GNAT superfamily N-acetyltransferase